MSRPFLLVWLIVILALLVPSAASRFLIDLAGGLMLILLGLPILLAGAGWIGWRFLKSKMVTCELCGTIVLNNSMNCPACGSNLSSKENNLVKENINSTIEDARNATIDINAKDVD